MSPAEWVAIIAALGGGATLQAAVAGLTAYLAGAKTKESEQAAMIHTEVVRARESEKSAWDRVRDLEARHDERGQKLDRITRRLFRWREYAHRLEMYYSHYHDPTNPLVRPEESDDDT